MRFHLGAIPEAADFKPDTPWRPLHEPTPWMMQVLALPIGLAAAAAVAVLWITIIPLDEKTWMLSTPGFLLTFAGIVVVHEFVHAGVHPLQGRSSHSVLGFWPSRMVFYAAYTGELSRNRLIAIFLMPLVVISLVPLLVAALVQTSSAWIVFVSTFNALLACGDIFGAGLVWWQIPATAIVRNQGWQTYWRDRTAGAEPRA